MDTKFKYFIKKISPIWVLSYFRKIRDLPSIYNYWFPFVFKDGYANFPKSITFELTYRCNLKCVMCPQALDLKKENSILKNQMKENTELNLKEIESIINEARIMKVQNIILTGGEPFIRKDINYIIQSIKNNKLTCNIITNGGLITEKNVDLIVDLGVDRITFSLDGPEDIHNLIRKNKRLFQDIINIIRIINNTKKRRKKFIPDISLNMTVSSLNAHRLNELIDIAYNEKVNVSYGYVFYTSKEMKEKTIALSPPTGGKIEDQDIPVEIKAVNTDILYEEILKTEKKAKKLGVKIDIQPPIKNRKELQERFYNDDYSFVNNCYYPWYAMRINPYGDVYPCSMNRRIGNIREQKLSYLWNNDQYVKFRKDLRNVGIWPQCTKCCALNNKLWDQLPKFRWYWEDKK